VLARVVLPHPAGPEIHTVGRFLARSSAWNNLFRGNIPLKKGREIFAMREKGRVISGLAQVVARGGRFPDNTGSLPFREEVNSLKNF